MKTEPKVKKTKQMPRHQKEKVKRIAVAIAKDPEATVRDIAENTGIAKSTVHNNMGHIGQVKEKWLEDLLSVDIQIMQSATLEINRRINDEEEKKQIKATELSQIAQHSTDRFMKFRWTATDEHWGLNAEALAKMSVDELLSIIKNK